MIRHSTTAVLLIAAAVSVCTSARAALLLMALVALSLLFTVTVQALLSWMHLPCPAPLFMLFAAAAGGCLYWCFCAFIGGRTLGDPLLLLTVCALCGAMLTRHLPPARMFRLCAALLVVGILREATVAATLFGYPLPFAPLGERGTYGLLSAAAVLWVFRVRPHIGRVHVSPTAVWQTALLTATINLFSYALPNLSTVWRFWGCLLVSVVAWTALPHLPAPLLLLPSVTACLPNVQGELWLPLVVGGCVLAGLPALNAVSGRLSRTPHGVRLSALLCLAAVLAAALGAV